MTAATAQNTNAFSTALYQYEGPATIGTRLTAGGAESVRVRRPTRPPVMDVFLIKSLSLSLRLSECV